MTAADEKDTGTVEGLVHGIIGFLAGVFNPKMRLLLLTMIVCALCACACASGGGACHCATCGPAMCGRTCSTTDCTSCCKCCVYFESRMGKRSHLSYFLAINGYDVMDAENGLSKNKQAATIESREEPPIEAVLQTTLWKNVRRMRETLNKLRHEEDSREGAVLSD